MKNEKTLSGKEYWRSLGQLTDSPVFNDFLHREFPEGASELKSAVSRRQFLSLMGASIAFAGLASCRRPVEKIIPYVTAPENIIPGIPQYYATTMPMGLSAYGVLVESHEGRPTKIEGNEKHPSSRGAANAFMQASILGLYDPDRSDALQSGGNHRAWQDFVTFWRENVKKFETNQGAGLAVLSPSFSSPTLFRLYKLFQNKFPLAKWVAYEPVSDENILRGIEYICGEPVQPVYKFENAGVVLSLESDFLLNESENISTSKGFAAGRKVIHETDTMNRLYVVENNFSITGGMADHRLRLRSGQITSFAVALARYLRDAGSEIRLDADSYNFNSSEIPAKWVSEVGKDLLNHKGSCLVISGRRQPPEVHALVTAINMALGNLNKTIEFKKMPEAVLSSTSALTGLAEEIKQGRVNTLFMLGGNPAYNAPGDLEFGKILERVDTTIHLSPYADETSQKSDWHIPMTHFLEEWGDARAVDGTLSVIQPLIEPLFNGKSMIEVAELMVSGRDVRGYETVRETWQSILPKTEFEQAWQRVLHDGLLEGSVLSPVPVSIVVRDLSGLMSTRETQASVGSDNLEIVFQASSSVYDGRFSNNGWLQELPDPITKIAWDNVLQVSPALADKMNFKSGDMAELQYRGIAMKLPVWIQPGHAENSVTVTLGYGRNGIGRIADNTGFNVYPLRSSAHPDFDVDAKLIKTGDTYNLAVTQEHGSMEGRPLVREGTINEFRKNPEFAKEMVEHPPLRSLWEEHPYDKGYQWGMTIDLNSCTGCNACVIACQSENNIPIVGKEQISRGREMHWIRLDRYYAGDTEDPEMVIQPVACQQCENAPCEQVCPVQATSHDKEGLNVMTYNRCIGTRYCSNNCPYKVRRFNFFNYTKDYPEVIKMAQNPDVTVRSRGVMEKCTYCLQRISEAKINAKNEGRTLKDGEVRTACQQGCPTDAIVFGNILDPESEVVRMKNLPRDYTMLGELNVKTRTTYLAKLRNPNPALAAMGQDGHRS